MRTCALPKPKVPYQAKSGRYSIDVATALMTSADLRLEEHLNGQVLSIRAHASSRDGIVIFNRPAAADSFTENRILYTTDHQLTIRVIELLISGLDSELSSLIAANAGAAARLRELEDAKFFDRGSYGKRIRPMLRVSQPFSEDMLSAQFGAFLRMREPSQDPIAVVWHGNDAEQLAFLRAALSRTGHGLAPDKKLVLKCLVTQASAFEHARFQPSGEVDNVIVEMSGLIRIGSDSEFTIDNLNGMLGQFPPEWPMHVSIAWDALQQIRADELQSVVDRLKEAIASRTIVIGLSTPSVSDPREVWAAWEKTEYDILHAALEAGLDVTRLSLCELSLNSILQGPVPTHFVDLDLSQESLYFAGDTSNSLQFRRESHGYDACELRSVFEMYATLQSSDWCAKCRYRNVCPSFSRFPSLVQQVAVGDLVDTHALEAVCRHNMRSQEALLAGILNVASSAIGTSQ